MFSGIWSSAGLCSVVSGYSRGNVIELVSVYIYIYIIKKKL